MGTTGLMIRLCAVVSATILVSSVDCRPEEPLPNKAETAKFVLVPLDQSMTLPAKVDPPKKLVGPWDFTQTPFSDLAMVLRVKNLSNHNETFSFIDTWYVQVMAEDGHKLELEGGRDATRQPLESDFLLAEPSQTVNFLIECRLSYGSDKRLVLWGSDHLGGIWAYASITPGKYRIYAGYAFEPPWGNMLWHQIAKEKLGMDLDALWKGDAKSNAIEIDVR